MDNRLRNSLLGLVIVIIHSCNNIKENNAKGVILDYSFSNGWNDLYSVKIVCRMGAVF